MIYQSNHQAPTMSSTRKTSPRPQHRNLQASPMKCANAKAKRQASERAANEDRCRGRCRVQWSEKHVKEGLVLVQEAQLARVVKTGPITEHYEIDPKPFASGQWARVYRCRSRSSGIVYAAKYSSRNRFNAECSAELRHEIALLSLCSQSPRVVRLHDVYETPKEIIMVMEYAPGGDLQTLIDGDLVPLEGDVVHFVRQLVEGLAYLHERNIAHLDIKPQNLVMMGTFPECDVKLCDFEISRVVLEGTEVREILGTPDYVAPEILHYEPITLAADMWSLGVTTYVLLTGFSPFGGETDQETFQNISLGEVDFPEELFEDISAQAKDFVAKLLVLDPNARLTAKQCLRHDWLRGAPTQASPHLRRYLSKSREVLLERVVSRENLRRAALLSQTNSQANLSTDMQEQSQLQGLQDCLLSQSEMCLNYSLSESRLSLAGSEGFPSPADSQASLNSSRTSLSCASQSCLLNKEQTQGLLSRAQSRSQANLNHGASRNLLSRIRSLNRVQSQACLLNGNSAPAAQIQRTNNFMNPVISRSREKLYGLRSLSKSQGVLDIYRSLECLRRRRKTYQRAKTEDMLPIFKQLDAEIAASGVSVEADDMLSDGSQTFQTSGMTSETERKANALPDLKITDTEVIESENGVEICVSTEIRLGDTVETTKGPVSGSEEHLDSLKSIESDTLTEDSDETPVGRRTNEDLVSGKRTCQRQHSDASSHSNNSGISDDKEDRSTESENEEPKFTVAQLVSAFNKHQEVASRTSLEAIMSERRINEVNFPTGPKALRLFIPDIDITESTIVRRKTSYKPRKNWEELRKRSEKNEGVLKNFDHDSGNEDDDEDEYNQDTKSKESDANDIKDETPKEITSDNTEKEEKNDIIKKGSTLSLESWSFLQSGEIEKDSVFNVDTDNRNINTTIDEKYKQCVKSARTNKVDVNDKTDPTPNNESVPNIEQRTEIKSIIRQKERLPNYIYSDVPPANKTDHESSRKTNNVTTNGRTPQKAQKPDQKKVTAVDTANVNLKDILQRVDSFQSTPKENMENLRKRTSITKIIVNDNLTHDSTDSNGTAKNDVSNRTESRAKSEPPSNSCQTEERVKLVVPPSFVRSSSLSSDSSCPTPSSAQSDINESWEDVQDRSTTVESNQSLDKEDTYRPTRKTEKPKSPSEKSKQLPEEKKLWGRVCTGSYTRAMEKFHGKSNDVGRKPISVLSVPQQMEKTRRKSSPAMPQYVNI